MLNSYSAEIEDWVRSLNSYHFDRALRQYQLDIISYRDGNYGVGADVFKPCECIVFRNLDIAYRIYPNQSIWVLASGLSRGHPIKEVYNAETGSVLWSEDGKPQSRIAHYIALDFAGNLPELREDGSPSIILGDPNFAHFHWNEAPALDRVLQCRLINPDEIHIFARVEPLSPLREIFPELSTRFFSDFIRFPFGRSRRIFTHLGSQFIHKSYADRIAACIKAKQVTERCAKALRKTSDNCNIIWIACRNDKRAAINEVELIEEVIKQFKYNYENCIFLIDSFSLPDDFPSAGYKPFEAYFANRTQVALDYTKRIIRKIEDEASVIYMTGMRVSEAIRVALDADYYISPAGSIQHKVGWFTQANGTIHSNSASMSESALSWYANQAEIAQTPVGLGNEGIEDIEAPGSRRDLNYRIKDPKGAAQKILSDYDQRVRRH